MRFLRNAEEEERECEVVRDIIEDILKKQSHVFKDYVIEVLKYRVDYIRLFNKALEKHCATHNGIENIHRGALKVFLESMRRLKEQYIVRRNGWIVRRGVLPPAQPVQGGQS